MFKQFYRPKLMIFALAAALMLWPTVIVAMPLVPQLSHSLTELALSGDKLPVYSSYDLGSSGPSNCPSPQRFQSGTRTIYSYVPGEVKRDIRARMEWYLLDDDLNFVSDEPLAIKRGRFEAGDLFIYGRQSFSRRTAGNNFAVAVASNSGSGWVYEAIGVFRIADWGESAPRPGRCPLQ